jgi:hypothetical protein
MAEKTKTYTAKFPSELIRNAHKAFHKKVGRGGKIVKQHWVITNKKDEIWQLDSDDEFFLNYQEEIKDAEIKYFHYKASEVFVFSVQYNQGTYNTSTRISISLPSRTDIEMLFSTFDQFEENYRNSNTLKEKPKQNKTIYKTERNLPSCQVDKKLLMDLERYLHRKISYLEEITSEKEWKYSIEIGDTYGKENLSSIEQFNLTYFPEDVTRIAISVHTYLRSEILIWFSLYRSTSTLEISLNSENSRQNVEGIAAEILQIMSTYKTSNSFFHPPKWAESILISLFSFLFLGALLLFFINQYQISLILISMFFMLGIYFVFQRIKPYNIFDTKKNQRREKWSNWLIFSVLEFIIFAIFGNLIIKALFGS